MLFMGIKAFSALVVMGENLIYFFTTRHFVGDDVKLPTGDHFQPRLQVREESARAHLELNHGLQFVQPPVPLDGSINVPVKTIDIHFRGHDAVMDCQLAKGIHNGCHIDAVRALAGAGVATHAEPDGLAPERIVPSTHLDQADDLVGQKIHMPGEGAAAGA
jgi:hypothetical protein